MGSNIKSKAVFIGKSMLWSVLLYTSMMLAVYHDEVSNVVHGRNAVVVSEGIRDARPSEKQGVIKSIAAIVKTISGFASATSGI